MTDELRGPDPAAGSGDPGPPVHPATEAILGTNERRLRSVFETMTEGVVLIAADGPIISANPAAERILGLTRSEIEGRTYDGPQWEILRPDGTPMPPEEMAGPRAMAEKRIVKDVVMGAVKPDGAVTWINVSAAPLLDATGELEGVVGTFTDITTSKRAEDALREAEERHRGLFEESPIAIELYDAAGGLVSVNPACLELFGVDDVRALRGFDLFADPNLADEHKEKLRSGETVRYQSFFDFEKVRTLDLYRTSRTGAIWLDVLITPLNDPLSGYLLQIQDITERRRLEEESARAKYLLDRVGEISHAGGWEYDVESGRVTWTDEVYRIYRVGRDFDTSDVARIIEFCAPQSRPLLAEAFRRAVEVGEPYDLELPFDTADGSHRWMRTAGSPILDGGAVVRVLGNVMDITAYKQTEEALLQTTDRLALATRAGGVGVWDYDPVNDTLTWDEQMFALYGITREQFTGAYEAWQAGLYPDDRERADAETQAALSGGKEFDTEFRVLWPDGSVHHIRALARVQRDAAGAPTRMIGTNWDVTPRQRLEAALRASEANFRNFFEAVDDIIMVATPDGRIVYANLALFAKLGYSAEEVAGMHVLDLNPSDRRAEAEAIFAAMLSGERESCPLPLQARSGALIPAETRVWFGEWDGEACVFGVCKDLRAEQEALQKFDSLFRHNPALMAVSDLPGRRFTDVNEAFLEALGYERAEVIGRTSAELGVIPQPEKQEAIAQQMLAHGRVSDCELKVQRKDGTLLDGVFSGEIIESQGRQYFLTVMLDQTERKQAEEALRDSEEKHRLLIENSHDIIYTLTADGVFLFVSPAWTALLGHPLDHVAGQPFQQFVHPDDLPGCMVFLQAVIETGQRQEGVEYRVRHHDGSWRWHTSSAVPLRDEAGTVIGLEGTARDITERKLAEEALQESEKRFRALVEWTPEAIVVHRHGKLIYVNPAAVKLFGATAAPELVGKAMLELIHPDFHEIVLGRVKQGLEDDLGAPLAEVKYLKLDGTTIDAEVQGTPIIYDGEPAIHVALRDITERKQAEEALREAADRLALATRAGGVGVWDWDVVNDKLTWDEQMFALYGVRREQFAGANEAWRAGVHPDDMEQAHEAVRLALNGEKELDSDFRVLRPDGSVRLIRALAHVRCDAAGMPTRMVGTNWDITERKKAEDEISRLNAELEGRLVSRTAQRDAFNRELETFAYSAAHDLRAPLRAIDGFSRILVEDAAERLTPEELGHLERVRAAAQRMALMIDDLMGLSKVARLPLQRRTVDVSGMAREVAGELRAAQPERRIELVVAPGLTAAADPALLRLVLLQLLDNAWKFTSTHAEARIEVGVTDSAGGDERVFFVRDDGVGFDMAGATQLFGAFQRFHALGRFEGDGIGLATAQRLVLRHGGRVWAEAEVEKGATFFFTMPEAEAARD